MSKVPTVLVVDDDAQVLSAIERRLARSGFRVLTAATGREAVDSARMHQPDAMTLDLRLPVFDGLEVEALLRKNPRTRDIPIIFITGQIESGLKDAFGKMKNAYFIRKPYDPNLLVRLLNSVLGIDELVRMRGLAGARR